MKYFIILVSVIMLNIISVIVCALSSDVLVRSVALLVVASLMFLFFRPKKWFRVVLGIFGTLVGLSVLAFGIFRFRYSDTIDEIYESAFVTEEMRSAENTLTELVFLIGAQNGIYAMCEGLCESVGISENYGNPVFEFFVKAAIGSMSKTNEFDQVVSWVSQESVLAGWVMVEFAENANLQSNTIETAFRDNNMGFLLDYGAIRYGGDIVFVPVIATRVLTILCIVYGFLTLIATMVPSLMEPSELLIKCCAATNAVIRSITSKK